MSDKKYDLLERTQKFAKKTRNLLSKLPKTIPNNEDIKQLARASASVAANYIEANEALSKKDFYYRIRVCKKESRESILYLTLINTNQEKSTEIERNELIQEATELMKIFGAIVTKAS